MRKFLKVVGVVVLALVVIGVWGRYDSVEHPRRFMQVMNGYLSLVEGYAALAKDPSASGVAASLGAKDLLEESKSPEESVRYFEDVLPRVTDPAVRRSVRVQLAELYKKVGQPDKALEQYHVLMVDPDAAAATQPVGGSEE